MLGHKDKTVRAKSIKIIQKIRYAEEGHQEGNDPPLIKSCTDIQQFVQQPLQLNYPNHIQSVERALKMAATPSGRIAGTERQIGEALCSIAGKKAM